MSLVYSETAGTGATAYKGIIQVFEKEAGFNRGDVSGDTNLLKEVTADINLAFDDFWAIALPAAGSWDLDDSNQTDYPVIGINLVSGQRDYAPTTDASSNLILEIKRVAVANSAGVFSEIFPVDQQTPDNNNSNTLSFIDGRNTSGIPIRYDKTANGIFLDPIPNYSYTNGIKLMISREPSYFTSTDTTRKPGVPGTFHKYFPLKAAMDWARRKQLITYPSLVREVEKMERGISDFYASRQRDVQPRMGANVENNK